MTVDLSAGYTISHYLRDGEVLPIESEISLNIEYCIKDKSAAVNIVVHHVKNHYPIEQLKSGEHLEMIFHNQKTGEKFSGVFICEKFNLSSAANEAPTVSLNLVSDNVKYELNGGLNG